MNKLILVGCEESGTITNLLREAGHEAYSCDIQDTRGNPEWHIKGCVFDAIRSRQWDLIILHPPCTALALSGNRWYGRGMPRHAERLDSIDWTVKMWEAAKEHAPRVALENPTSVIFNHLDSPVCYVQPYEFGHGEQKRTGFALHGLPPLVPTDVVDGREQRIWKMGPSATRQRDRSKTYPGIARAIVNQWARI